MITEVTGFPKQRIPYSQKVSKKFLWAKECIDSILSYRDQEFIDYRPRGGNSLYDEMISNYRLYNNQIDEDEWVKNLDPLGLEDQELYTDIHVYNESYNKINTVIGEEDAKPFNFRAIKVGEGGILSKETERTRLFRDYVQATVEAERMKLQIEEMRKNPPPNIQDKQAQRAEIEKYQEMIRQKLDAVMPPEEIEQFISTKYLDHAEIAANKIMKYLYYKETVADKMNDALKHQLLSAGEFMWVGVEDGEPVIKVLNSPNCTYYKSPEIKYIEDGLFASYSTVMDGESIIDKWGDELSEDEIKDLSGSVPASGKPARTMDYTHYNYDDRYTYFGGFPHGQYDTAKQGDWVVTHCEWRSSRKVGFLVRIDMETGIPEELVVDETYKMNPELGDLDIEWDWIPEIWEGLRIGADIYVGIRPKPNPFFNPERPHVAPKLGYHGLIISNMNAEPISMMGRMRPYQFLYFVIVSKVKELIRDDLGTLLGMDTSMIDSKLSPQQWYSYIKKTKTVFYNSLQNKENPGTQRANTMSPQGAVEISNAQAILAYLQVMDYIEKKIGRAAGVPEHREGGANTYDAVRNVQQNIIQSSYVTSVYSQAHRNAWARALNSLLEAAQIAWSDNPNSKVWMDGHTKLFISNEDIQRFTNSEMGLFVTDRPSDLKALQALRDLTVPIVQNEVQNVSRLIAILQSDSIAEIKNEVTAMEKEEQRIAQQQEERQLKAQEDQHKREIENREDIQSHQLDVQQVKGEYDLEKALITALGFDPEKDRNDNDIADVLEITKQQIEERKLALEEKKEANRHSEAQKKLKIDERKSSK